MNIQSFSRKAAFEENRVNTKVLLETSFSKEIQILMKAGQVMNEHKTPYPILIHLLEGQIELGVEGKLNLMEQNDIVALDGGIPHNLFAKENSIIRLTLSKFDSVERLKGVIES